MDFGEVTVGWLCKCKTCGALRTFDELVRSGKLHFARLGRDYRGKRRILENRS